MSKLHTATMSDQLATKAAGQEMAHEIGRTIRQSVNQTMTDSASRNDAIKRETVRERHGAVVANALAGQALDALYRKCLAANAAAPETETGAPDPAEYFKHI